MLHSRSSEKCFVLCLYLKYWCTVKPGVTTRSKVINLSLVVVSLRLQCCQTGLGAYNVGLFWEAAKAQLKVLWSPAEGLAVTSR